MKSITCKSLFWPGLLGVCLAAASALVSTASGADAPSHYATNRADKAACETNLNLIFDAIQQYRTHHQQLPDKLSDLLSELIHDPKILFCPFVQKTGDVNSWARRVRLVGKSDLRTSYCYEFCLEPISREVWRGPPRTQRQYKELQLQNIGRPVVPIVRCLAHRPYLNLAYDGKIYETASLHWEEQFAHSPAIEHFTPAAVFGISPSKTNLLPGDFPAREAGADPRQLDLTKHYNALLAEPWQGFPGNTLEALRPGIQKFGGVPYDVRGAIQLEAHHIPVRFASRVDGIQVNQKVSRIHFLHATAFQSKSGTNVATYIVHYSDSDGQSRAIPIVYGKHIADWWFDPKRPSEPTDAKVAWSGQNEAAGGYENSIRLYQFTWENPVKDLIVGSISFVSTNPDPGPFLIAITVEL